MSTPRERYVQTLTFGNPDRVPFMPGGPRESTLRAWRTQGLPEDADWFEILLDELGLSQMPYGAAGINVSQKMIPEFEEKVLERRPGVLIVQDWMGGIVEISDEFDVTYLRTAKDFVTRSWLKCPVENRDDWAQMKERYRLDSPGRFAPDFAAQYKAAQEQGLPVTIQVNGPFWQMREWWGFENLCMLFLDDPEFVQDMVEFWTEFIAQLLERIFAEAGLDRLGISEDMAYKAHSMISPEMSREFLAPAYRRWGDIARANGCRLVDMDSDGFIEDLVPVWIEAGINVCDPIEVAAHNDLPRMRQRFGTQMAYTGGIDKRAMAAGGKVMEAEVMRVVPPLFKQGGYIPGCDHGVPPDISWPNFIDYSRLLAKLCGWL